MRAYVIAHRAPETANDLAGYYGGAYMGEAEPDAAPAWLTSVTDLSKTALDYMQARTDRKLAEKNIDLIQKETGLRTTSAQEQMRQAQHDLALAQQREELLRLQARQEEARSGMPVWLPLVGIGALGIGALLLLKKKRK